jgi:hypothetical protein
VSSIIRKNGRITVYPQDHVPRHVHVEVGEAQVIVELREDRTVALAKRTDAIRPADAQMNHVRDAIHLAAEFFDEAVKLWEKMHE